MSKEMTDEEAINILKQYADDIENAEVFFALQKGGQKRISEAQVKAIKIFITLRHFGINVVTTNLFMALYGKSRASALNILHLLGDRGVLTLVHGKKNKMLRYILSPKFTDTYEKTPARKI